MINTRTGTDGISIQNLEERATLCQYLFGTMVVLRFSCEYLSHALSLLRVQPVAMITLPPRDSAWGIGISATPATH